MKTIQDATDKLRALFPALDFSSGYIGNVERGRDSRSWRIWCSSIQIKSPIYEKQNIFVSAGSTNELPTSTAGWDGVVSDMVVRIAKASPENALPENILQTHRDCVRRHLLKSRCDYLAARITETLRTDPLDHRLPKRIRLLSEAVQTLRRLNGLGVGF